jgi:hypothetical protein
MEAAVVNLNFTPMKPLYFLLFILCFLSVNGQKNKHSRWDQQLKKYVDEQGLVDYKNWLTEKNELDAYIQTLEKMPPLETASKEAKLAYWINAYNALTVQLILENYPTKSIKEIKKPWDTDCIEVRGEAYTLGEIEHEILRKMDEARIHFAINCASASCPNLLNEAFSEKQMETQLTAVTKAFLKDSTKNKLNPSHIELSRIFLWFGKDFGSKAERLEFISRYSELTIKNPKIDYLPYDWSLNKSN